MLTQIEHVFINLYWIVVGSFMNNRLFSLIIVPDSGNEMRSGSFNHKFILGIFGSLISVFFICIFFIVGYHIKLSQEINYKRAVSAHRSLISKVDSADKTLDSLAETMMRIQNNDKAFRLIESMKVVDNEMYQAGIGGHVIADVSEFENFGDDLRVKLSEIAVGTVSLASRISTQKKSFVEIDQARQINREIFDNTPTIIPTQSYRVTSSYGYRTHPISGIRQFHAAIDIGGMRGQDIYATADGVVTVAKYQPMLGNTIVIRHKYGYETLYAHLDKILVKEGQQVNKRDVIGAMGRTGNATGVHLHYAVSLNNRAENPVKYFK